MPSPSCPPKHTFPRWPCCCLTSCLRSSSPCQSLVFLLCASILCDIALLLLPHVPLFYRALQGSISKTVCVVLCFPLSITLRRRSPRFPALPQSLVCSSLFSVLCNPALLVLISFIPLLLLYLILEGSVSKAVPRKSKSSARKVSLTFQMNDGESCGEKSFCIDLLHAFSCLTLL